MRGAIKDAVKGIPILGPIAKALRRAASDLASLSVEYYYHQRSVSRRESGVTKTKRKTPLIVSLTSIPQRLNKTHLCVESLLGQSLKPDYLVLWLAEDIKREELSENLLRLEERGLQIRFCRDIRAYKKIIFILWSNYESVTVTADDDVIYPGNWLGELYDSYEKDPRHVHCRRAHLMTKDADGNLKKYGEWDHLSKGFVGPSFLLFPTGVGGVLYPPGALNREVLNEKVFTDICLWNDDIWLKAMSLLNAVKCRKTKPFSKELRIIRGSQTFSLYSKNVGEGKNDEQIKAVFGRYDLFRLL